MELTMQEKLKLIDFFEFQLDKEISKPLGQMDSEVVDSYIKVLLDLQDKHIELSPEFINEQVRKIFHPEEKTAPPEAVKTTKKYFNKKKVWLVAACIAILVALFSIVSFSSERSVADVLEDFFGTFEFIPFGEEVSVGDETYGKDGKGIRYNSIEEFVENEEFDLLFPSNKIDDVSRITITNTDKYKDIHIAFNNANFFITIEISKSFTKDIFNDCNKKIILNGTQYYLCLMDDVSQAQAYFIHNNNLYTITHTDEKALIDILNNMEEIRYEN